MRASSFNSSKFYCVLLGLYGLSTVVSRTLMDICGWFLVFYFWVSLGDLLLRSRPVRISLTRGRILTCAILYFLVSLGHLFLLEKIDRSRLVFVDLQFILIPFLTLYPRVADSLRAQSRNVSLWIEYILRGLSVFYFLSLIASVYQIFTVHGRGAAGFLRIDIFYAYNHLIGLLFFVTLLKSDKKIGRFSPRWSFFTSCIVFLCILLSASRTASFVAAFVWLYGAFPYVYKHLRLKGVLAMGSLLMAASFILLSTNKTFQRKYTRELLGGKSIMSLRSREYLWKRNWNLFLTHPIAGVGYRQNYLRPLSEAPQEINKSFSPEPAAFLAHNIFLQALAEGGIVGTLLLLGAFGLLAFEVEGLKLMYLGILISGLTDTPLSEAKTFHPIFFYTLLLATLAVVLPGWSKLRAAR